MSHIRATTVEDEQDARDAEIDAERAKVVKHLGIEFFLEAIAEAPELAIAECVANYKDGDTLLLGMAVKEIIADYVEKCSNRTNRGSR
jgi:hypothetical protein